MRDEHRPPGHVGDVDAGQGNRRAGGWRRDDHVSAMALDAPNARCAAAWENADDLIAAEPTRPDRSRDDSARATNRERAIDRHSKEVVVGSMRNRPRQIRENRTELGE